MAIDVNGDPMVGDEDTTACFCAVQFWTGNPVAFAGVESTSGKLNESRSSTSPTQVRFWYGMVSCSRLVFVNVPPTVV